MTAQPTGPVVIRTATSDDAGAIAEIYNHYITSSIATFEEEPVSAETLRQRMTAVERAALPWLVAEARGAIDGYAYAAPWRERRAYRFSVETTVYLRPGQAGRGLGVQLYQAIISALASRGVHAAMGGISLPNEPSIALHEKLGFRKVAHFPEVGFKFGRWIDVGYWQLLFPVADT